MHAWHARVVHVFCTCFVLMFLHGCDMGTTRVLHEEHFFIMRALMHISKLAITCIVLFFFTLVLAVCWLVFVYWLLVVLVCLCLYICIHVCVCLGLAG